MRQIKFRGKDIETGEWIYGSLVQPIGKNPSIYVQDVKTEGVASFFVYDVEESTVGQFTGLLDRNGNEIYEGDIIVFYTQDEDFSDAVLHKGVVEWSDGSTIINIDYFNNICGLYYPIYCAKSFDGCEVLGNIHDNPDILNNEQNYFEL